MDTIFIRELRLDAWIGLYRHEKIAPQAIELDIEIDLASEAVFQSQRVSDTVDYAVVVQRIAELLRDERYGLVETLAERIASLILDGFPAARVRLSVAKLGAVREAKRVGVRIERTGPARSQPGLPGSP